MSSCRITWLLPAQQWHVASYAQQYPDCPVEGLTAAFESRAVSRKLENRNSDEGELDRSYQTDQQLTQAPANGSARVGTKAAQPR